MSDRSSGVSGGILAATKNGAATLLATGRTRLELLANEFAEEKLRALRLLFLAQVAAFCLIVGTILVLAVLTVLFWEQRLLLLSILSVGFLLAGGAALLALRRGALGRRHLFTTSIAELEHDISLLQGAARGESRAD
ncbi:phage holin family protein [Accumulibacter sp.]|uniref:phage holin family protein n=1 Tax=Accumulibacter sp. TaxID=2053492 RepID=UPI0026015E8B|nr:phage holin family protein [Accumulibacter sp.]MCM8612659.1 phage holin family protein [Accumulibacter sp.]MCM8636079.1 phage holin family protein [Accumulibacter sp.]MCM8639977.1 phage holin family protein [Accumulibacter sp.]